MPPRIHLPFALQAADDLALPAEASRHLQVLRLQPGAPLVVFDGLGGEWSARVLQIGRKEVSVAVEAHRPVEREAARRVTLALGMPANERMDALVEKATELGAAGLQPLLTARAVLRLDGERAERKRLHWQQVAVAACEQCGRNRVPPVAPVQALAVWLAGLAGAPAGRRWLLSADGGRPLAAAVGDAAGACDLLLLSGPEGGLSADEQALARGAGFDRVSLGPRVLRADTAPLAALAGIVAFDGHG